MRVSYLYWLERQPIHSIKKRGVLVKEDICRILNVVIKLSVFVQPKIGTQSREMNVNSQQNQSGGDKSLLLQSGLKCVEFVLKKFNFSLNYLMITLHYLSLFSTVPSPCLCSLILATRAPEQQ